VSEEHQPPATTAESQEYSQSDSVSLLYFLLSTIVYVKLAFGYVQYEILGRFGVYEEAIEPQWIQAYAVCSFVMVTVSSCVLLLFVATRSRRLWLRLLINAGALTVLQVGLFVDSRFYTAFKRHVTLDDLGVFYHASPFAQIGIQGELLRSTFIKFTLVLALHPLLACMSYAVVRWGWSPRNVPRIQWRIIFGGLVALFLLDRAIYATLVLRNDSLVSRLVQRAPFYPDWGMQTLADRVSGRTGERRAFEARVDELLQAKLRQIPAEPFRVPQVATSGKSLPNVLMIVIETGAARFVDPETTPNLCRFREGKIVAHQHYAAANATHQSLFGIIFTQPPARFDDYRKAERSPQACDVLEQLGYKLRFAGAFFYTHMGLFQFAFAHFQPADVLLEEHADERNVAAVTRWQEEPGPQFIIMEVHAPHYPYINPAPIFFPQAPDNFPDTWDAATHYAHRQDIATRYRNSLHYGDSCIGHVLQSVNLSNTVVVVTADHGEEFYEHGRLAHSSAFNDEQTLTPLVLSIPGQAQRDIDTLTSHFDLVPTILDAIGVRAKADEYGLGRSLLSDPQRDYVIAAMCSFSKTERWGVVTRVHKVDFTFTKTKLFTLHTVFNRKDEPLWDFMRDPDIETTIHNVADACAGISRCYAE
jgi:membrane-anchored protein YejM (alkaline phosphatase superfamily)